MYTYTQRLLFKAPSVRRALALEPAIRPSFASASMADMPVIIFAAMWNGLHDVKAIHRYLHGHECRLESDEIDFVLDTYEGENPSRHLWIRGVTGGYLPLLEALRMRSPDDL